MITNPEAFHILTADIDDEVYLRVEVVGRMVMGNRLHNTDIQMEGMLHQLLPIARYRTVYDVNAVLHQGIELCELLLYNIHGISHIPGIAFI